MAEYAPLQRARRLEAEIDDIIKMLPERLPQDLSRLQVAKAELEHLIRFYRLASRMVLEDEEYRAEILRGLQRFPIYLEEVERCLQFEQQRSAFFPDPGQTMEVTCRSGLRWLREYEFLLGSRTAAGINIWQFKSQDAGKIIVEIQDFRICGLCGQDGADVHYLKCGQCRRIRYCSKSCQRAHWKRHKIVCIIPIMKNMIGQVRGILQMLPERLPQGLSRLIEAKNTLEAFRLKMISGMYEEVRPMLCSIEMVTQLLQEIEKSIEFERERSAFFPEPGQTMEVSTVSARNWMQDKVYLVGQRTAAGINIWRVKSREQGQIIVEFEDKSICGLCGQDGADVHYLKCGQCRRIRYCTKSCQRAHWKEHKTVCAPREV